MSLSDEQRQRIREQEETLAEVQRSLEEQLSWSHSRLRAESERAQDLTQSIVAARRDVDKQMLASDEAVAHQLRDSKREEIETLVRIKEKPYFAHIVLEEQDAHGRAKTVEYKLGVAANSDCRIIDWRKAPIAKLYYEYKEGEDFSEDILGREREGRVAQRNKVDIEAGALHALSCGLGSFVKNGSSEEWEMRSAGVGGRRRDRGALPNVLQLITPEQFKMITEDAESAVLIQGIAGSGKTTVALYRLAWLLHEDNSDVRPPEVAVVVYSRTLKRYIEEALPSLELQSVSVRTFEDWAIPFLRSMLPQFFDGTQLRSERGSGQPSVERAKRSMAALMRLEEYATLVQRRIFEALEVLLSQYTLPSTIQSRVQLAFQKAELPLPLMEDLQTAVKSLERSEAILALSEWIDDSVGKLRDIPSHLLRIFGQGERLLRFDDSKLLDLEILEATKQSLSDSLAARRISQADIALCIRLGQCLGFPMRRLDAAAKPYRHLVVDEVQDFGASELAAMIASVEETSQLTIVGDSSQQVETYTTFPGWERLRSHWSLGSELSQFHFLSVSHRSTREIMRLADHVLGTERSVKGRPGKAPLWFSCRREQSMVTEALKWLERISERFPDMLIAVICRNEQEARYVHSLLTPTFPQNARLGIDEQFSFDEGILVTHVREVKGLEFEAVLIWDCSARKYPDKDWARRWLYVALTRAEEYVCLVSAGRPSPLLPSVHSKLVRGYREEIEEDAEEIRDDEQQNG